MSKPRIVSLNWSDPYQWPEIPGLSPEALAVPPEVFWKRIESYTGDVFSPRPFVIEIAVDYPPARYFGLPNSAQQGYIRLPITNPTNIEVEKYLNTHPVGWTSYGGFTDGSEVLLQGRYRVRGIGGHYQVPATVLEAAKRFAEYSVSVMQRPEGVPAGVESYSVSLGGAISETYRFSGKALGSALINSGAADLLRPYRKKR